MSTSHDASAQAAMRAMMSDDPDLNQTDRNVYAYLVYRANGARLCWKRMDEIQADLKIGTRRTVCNSTRKLKAKGLIEIRHRQRDSNHYRILDPDGRLYSYSGGSKAANKQPLDGKETAHLSPPFDGKETALLSGFDGKETSHQS